MLVFYLRIYNIKYVKKILILLDDPTIIDKKLETNNKLEID